MFILTKCWLNGTCKFTLLYKMYIIYYDWVCSLVIQVGVSGVVAETGDVALVAMVTEAPPPGGTWNRNLPERSPGLQPSPSGNSTTCPSRVGVSMHISLVDKGEKDMRAGVINIVNNSLILFNCKKCIDYFLSDNIVLISFSRVLFFREFEKLWKR